MPSIPTAFLFRAAGFALTLPPLCLTFRAAPSRDFTHHATLTHAHSCEETHLLMAFVKSLGVAQWTMHLDLHETTDSDLYEFRPAKASRDGVRCP